MGRRGELRSRVGRRRGALASTLTSVRAARRGSRGAGGRRGALGLGSAGGSGAEGNGGVASTASRARARARVRRGRGRGRGSIASAAAAVIAAGLLRRVAAIPELSLGYIAMGNASVDAAVVDTHWRKRGLSMEPRECWLRYWEPEEGCREGCAVGDRLGLTEVSGRVEMSDSNELPVDKRRTTDQQRREEVERREKSRRQRRECGIAKARKGKKRRSRPRGGQGESAGEEECARLVSTADED